MAKKPKTAAPTADQPYYLQRAHIKDFRSIRDAAVEFKPGLNIIIGANGSGKTNFIECVTSGLDSLSRNFIAGNESTFSLGGTNNIDIFYKKGYLTDDSKQRYDLLDELQTQSVTIKSNSTKLTGESIIDILSAHYESSLNKFGELIFSRVITVRHGVPKVYQFINTTFEFLISNKGRIHLAKDKDITPTSLQEIKKLLSNLIQLGYKGNNIDLEKATLLTISLIETWLNHLRHYLAIYSPITDIRHNIPIQSYRNINQDENIIKGSEAIYLIDNNWLPFEALSSGTQRILYILSEVSSLSSTQFRDVIHSISQSNEPNKIILLEEPELGIHPDQLEKLLLFLREQSQKHQLIITTHSPQVLDMLNDDELDRITICELDKKKGTQFRKLKKTQIAAAKKYMSTQGLYLSDYWRYGSLENTH